MSRNDFRNELADLRLQHPITPPSLPETEGTQGEVRKGEPLPIALPDILTAREIQGRPTTIPPLLVDNILHRGCKMSISGGSKSFKSWVLIDLGLSVASGIPWWGFKCRKGRVLYINFELISSFLKERVESVCASRGIEMSDDFLVWNLRTCSYSLPVLTEALEKKKDELGEIDLIIIDPIYKALGDLDENSNSDINKLMKQIEDLGNVFGATTVFGSHFAKGNASGKTSKDRAAGAGVFSRDPDVMMTLTEHEDDDCYTIESDLRYLPRLSPFVMKWEFPRMVRAEGKDPRRLKGLTQAKDKSPTKGGDIHLTPAQVFNCLPLEGANDAFWRKHVIQAHDVAGAAYYHCKKILIEENKVELRGQRYFPKKLRS